MQIKVLRCKPNARFHLGEVTETRSTTLTDTATYLHADILFGAFVYQLALLYPEKVEPFVAFFQNKQIQISSAFYCLENTQRNEKIFFLPKPLSLNLHEVKNEKGESLHKQLKKIQFLSWKVWQKGLLPPQWFDENLCKIINGSFVILSEEISPKEAEDLQIYKKDDTLKVRLHTTEEKGNLYNQTDLFLLGNKHWQVHWYFLEKNQLTGEDKEIYEKTWQNVAMAGIGGERSTGAGKIQSIATENLDTSFLMQESTQKMSVSLTFPQENERNNLLLYQLKMRGGQFLSENYRLKVLQAITEGAIQTQELQGKIESIGEKKLRYGINFTISLPEKFYFKANF
ncbi:type III-A CRISPR-associated RAMP protein Csm4 [Raineya sp.]